MVVEALGAGSKKVLCSNGGKLKTTERCGQANARVNMVQRT